MKIAYIVGGLPFGGVENMLLDTAKRLKEIDGFEPLVINVSGTGKRIPDFIKAGINLINVGSSKKAIKTFRLDTVKKLRDILKNENPDIVHTAHFSGDYFGRLASIGLNIPVITHIRNPRVEKRFFRRIANRFLSKYTTVYISISNEVRDSVEKWHNINNKENILLYNAINGERFGNAKPADLSRITVRSCKVLISTGRLVPEKNFDGLIKGFALIKDDFLDTSLVIVGEGHKRKEFELIIENQDLGNRVFLPGYRTDIPALLKGADYFALVSNTEGFGNTHLEAMFVGLPTLISDKVPTIEICKGATLVSTTEPANIAEKLTELFGNHEKVIAMGERGKEIASGYTIDNYVDKLIAIYKRLIKDTNER